MERNLKRISLVLFCIYVAAVIVLCFMKTDDIQELPKTLFGIPLDKAAHFLMFLPFPVLGYATFHPVKGGRWRDLALLAIMTVLGGAFALATERLQGLTEYRSYEITDMLADGLGIAVGTISVIAYIIFRKK